MSVYAWGSDRYGQLGLGRQQGLGQAGTALHTPTAVESLEAGVTHAAGGLGHSIVVTEFGDVFTCGRTVDGSLGTSVAGGGRFCATPVLVGSLGKEAVVAVAAGSQTSVALTAGGRVYTWGLVHVGIGDDGRVVQDAARDGRGGAEESATEGLDGQAATVAAAGALTGMAAAEARLAQDDVLSRVVRRSTEAWLMAEDDFGREMDLRGDEGATASAEVKSEGRDAYEGMLRVRTVRRPAVIPCVVRSLLGRRVRHVSAGYGHIMALTDDGQLYGAGYNDRGQLGLGHRINTAQFQRVRTFSDRLVAQVVCGQQHTLARVAPASDTGEGHFEVFVWGNGTLGQLGLGNSSTKLAPHRLACLDHEGVRDLAAGANHSLALSGAGRVFFWGHTEYGQSGRTKLGADYEVGGHVKFYEPQPIAGLEDVRAIACGATFSLALATSGHVISWGWNESSVLGQGTSGRTALTPTRIPGLGPPSTPPVTRISCGQTHAFAVTDASSSRLPTLRPLLGSGDVAVLVKAAPTDFLSELRSGAGRGASASRDVLYAHEFVLAARCAAFRDRIAKARGEGRDAGDSTAGDAASREAVVLELDHPDWSPATLRALLVYLYTDALVCPPHRYRQLRNLADFLGLVHLVFVLDGAIAQRSHVNRSFGMSLPVPEALSQGTAAAVVPSRFVEDLGGCIEVDAPASDVAFFLWETELRSYASRDDLQEEAEVVETLAHCLEAAGAKDEAGEARVVLFRAHKAVLRRSSYFDALMSGRFLESSDNAFADAFYVDVSAFLADGLTLSALRRFLRFLYTGTRTCVPEDPTGAMGLAVVAGRFDAPSLLRLCEQRLTEYVAEPENALLILDFANTFSLPRLQLLATDVIPESGSDAPETHAGDSEGFGVAEAKT